MLVPFELVARHAPRLERLEAMFHTNLDSLTDANGQPGTTNQHDAKLSATWKTQPKGKEQ